jgi:predicted AlkP superfamily pyrophosphatase or phosphodiesterase
MNRLNKKLFALVLICFALALSSAGWGWSQPRAADESKPTVILISIDAFRSDYLAKFKPPNLNIIARDGVQAKWMTPSYPSLTFPNHYTIVTGLYPEDHGIVGNEFFDPVFNATFSVSRNAGVTEGRWWGGEPIWVTAEKQGQHAACYFYPGSEAEIEGRRPTLWEHYEEKVPNAKRVDTVLSWLDLPIAERPTFVSLYFSDVDTAGHNFSPDSREVAAAVAAVDGAIGRLMQGLESRGLYDKVNVIVVSDHGMATLRPRDAIKLDEDFHADRAAHIVWGSQVTHIFPKEGQTAAIYAELSNGKVKHAECYLKENIPARFHYQNNRRIAPIVCMADEGWRFFSRQRYDDEDNGRRFPSHPIGAHGYDNQLPAMRATFLAHGPAFKSGVVVDPFDNVNVYDIMTTILKLKPAKNDGSMNVAREVLR